MSIYQASMLANYLHIQQTCMAVLLFFAHELNTSATPTLPTPQHRKSILIKVKITASVVILMAAVRFCEYLRNLANIQHQLSKYWVCSLVITQFD